VSKRHLDPAPIRKLAPPMAIHVEPKRDFSKNEQFDPFQLAGKGQGFEMYHKDCGGRIELRLREQVRRLLFVPLSSMRWYEFVCTACQEAYEIELTGHQEPGDECSFAQQCLRRVLVEKQGPYGSALHLSFHYRRPAT
jgi:hypothetical protein